MKGRSFCGCLVFDWIHPLSYVTGRESALPEWKEVTGNSGM